MPVPYQFHSFCPRSRRRTSKTCVLQMLTKGPKSLREDRFQLVCRNTVKLSSSSRQQAAVMEVSHLTAPTRTRRRKQKPLVVVVLLMNPKGRKQPEGNLRTKRNWTGESLQLQPRSGWRGQPPQHTRTSSSSRCI